MEPNQRVIIGGVNAGTESSSNDQLPINCRHLALEAASQQWRSCSGVRRRWVLRIYLWPLRRDDRSGVLIGARGTQRSGWPVRV